MLDVSRPLPSALVAVRSIPVDLICPDRNQARKHFDQDSLSELANSIRESGIIQPLVVRPRGSGYELIAGERRWRAAQIAGLHEVPAIVRSDLTEDECVVFGLVENLQRESLAPVDAAMGIQRLCDVSQLTHLEVGERIGKSREYVTGFLRLLNLTTPIADMVNRGELSVGHGKLIASLPCAQQASMAQEVTAQRLTVRQLERRISQLRPTSPRGFVAPSAPARAPRRNAELHRLEERLSDLVGARTRLEEEGGGKGRIVLSYTSLDELSGLLERLGYRED